MLEKCLGPAMRLLGVRFTVSNNETKINERKIQSTLQFDSKEKNKNKNSDNDIEILEVRSSPITKDPLTVKNPPPRRNSLTMKDITEKKNVLTKKATLTTKTKTKAGMKNSMSEDEVIRALMKAQSLSPAPKRQRLSNS